MKIYSNIGVTVFNKTIKFGQISPCYKKSKDNGGKECTTNQNNIKFYVTRNRIFCPHNGNILS